MDIAGKLNLLHLYLIRLVRQMRETNCNGEFVCHAIVSKTLKETVYQISVRTVNWLGEEIGSSAWYQALPASPERLQISHSLFSLASFRRILKVPIPLPYICVQNLRHRGLSGSENKASPLLWLFFIEKSILLLKNLRKKYSWHSFLLEVLIIKPTRCTNFSNLFLE